MLNIVTMLSGMSTVLHIVCAQQRPIGLHKAVRYAAAVQLNFAFVCPPMGGYSLLVSPILIVRWQL